jgi:hypothetical protein
MPVARPAAIAMAPILANGCYIYCHGSLLLQELENVTIKI